MTTNQFRSKRLCIVNVVGLTADLLVDAPVCRSIGQTSSWTGVVPAVTSTVQATLLTGKTPGEHGIVANGWYFRDTAEVRFWQQNNGLISGRKLYEGFETAKLFWWYNQNAPVRWAATPKPHYGCDGSKVFDIIDRTGCNLQQRHGNFPFFAFWGPAAGLASSRWIADAAATVLRENRPQLSLVYLPHLDYDYQRFQEHDRQRVEEVDACVKTIVEAAASVDTQVIVVSEYGLVPVDQPVYLNRQLRRSGLIEVRDGPFGEMLQFGESAAFAVCDHQFAHIYIREHADIDRIAALLEQIDGVASVHRPAELRLEHPRSGELVVLSKTNAWFAYPYWLDDERAPDFARTVDIHRKPGYDPCELFMTSKLRAAARLLQKKSGMRYRMDVVPLQPDLVGGSHGLPNWGPSGPLVIGPSPPNDMLQFPDYVRSLLG